MLVNNGVNCDFIATSQRHKLIKNVAQMTHSKNTIKKP